MRHGYTFYDPPLMEFVDALTRGAPEERKKLFRVTDPVSHETMALRSDITVQIARFAQTRLTEDGGAPLKLCYSGQVLRVAPDSRDGLRQRTQTGIEYIGGDVKEALCETAGLILRRLQDLPVEGLTLDISMPALARAVTERVCAGAAEREAFTKAMTLKDKEYVRFMVENVPGLAGTDINILLGTAEKDADIAAAFPAGLAALAETGLHLAAYVRNAFPEVAVRVDPSETRGFAYHRDAAFSVYAPANGREIAGGGHYRAGDADAAGATLYVEDMYRAAGNRRITA